MPKTLNAADLGQFRGSETLYTNNHYRPLQYTEGVRHVAVAGEAWWLLDLIVSYRHHPKVRGEGFQVWKLIVTEQAGLVTCDDGNDHQLVSQRIPFTDFPLETVTLWLIDNILLLPSEY
jgi:hypothetical protein